MKKLRFKKIDAFTRGIGTGNPAGCIYLDDKNKLSINEMQRIAKELKGFVNEVGFLTCLEDTFYLKFYSSECEVEFCGHAIIAILYDLIKGNKSLLERDMLPIYVNAGRLLVFNHISEEDAVYIMAPIPEFIPSSLSIDAVAEALVIDSLEIDRDQPLRIINAGLRTLIVPIMSLHSCLGVFPNQEQLRLFCITNNIDIILVFCRETFLASSHFRTRVFAPKYGYLEDPATGSGNAAFGHYLIEQGLWNENVIIEQGPSRDIPNIIQLRKYQTEKNDHILFGGASVLRIDGNYVLQD